MFVAPGSPDWLSRRLTRELAQRVARNWWVLLLNGLLLAVAGVLIFSIDWSVRSLSIFVGALFIMQGISIGLVQGLDRAAQRTNTVSGLASAAAGVAIIAWPRPGLQAVGIFLGAWLIVMGTLTISGSLAARHVLPDWWLWLIGGLLEVPLGVLALADPGATLAALITVAGIWAVSVGVMRVVLAFELKRLPHRIDELESDLSQNGHSSYGGRPLTRQSSGAAA
ncbi:MAG: HdeD family acid-resistance protein [Solirubrobacteraceae bacterium]